MLSFEKNGIEEIVEVGPGKVLTGMVAKTTPNIKAFAVNSLTNLKEYISR